MARRFPELQPGGPLELRHRSIVFGATSMPVYVGRDAYALEPIAAGSR